MATQWWIKSGNKVSKPLTPKEVQKLYKENRIPADALLSSDGIHWNTVEKLQANRRNASTTCKAAFRCPHCEASINHQRRHAGKVVPCPQCKLLFRVPNSVTAGTVAEPVSPNSDSNQKSNSLAPVQKSTKNGTPKTHIGTPSATLDAKSGTGRLGSLRRSKRVTKPM